MKQFIKGVRYALAGLVLAWKEGVNFRIELFCAGVALALGFYFDLSSLEFSFITLAISGVLAAEAFNTALEELCDKFQPTHDPHIAKIKDLAAAAVLITSMGAFVIGLIIFIPHLI